MTKKTTKRLAKALAARGSRPGKPVSITFEDGTKVSGDNLVIDGKDQKGRDSNDDPTNGIDEVDASGAAIEAPPAPAPQPTQAERVFASANAMVKHFSPDAGNVNIQIMTAPDVTFQRLADWMRIYASCLLAAAQAEQDASAKKE
jgi:hypothetical protein